MTSPRLQGQIGSVTSEWNKGWPSNNDCMRDRLLSQEERSAANATAEPTLTAAANRLAIAPGFHDAEEWQGPVRHRCVSDWFEAGPPRFWDPGGLELAKTMPTNHLCHLPKRVLLRKESLLGSFWSQLDPLICGQSTSRRCPLITGFRSGRHDFVVKSNPVVGCEGNRQRDLDFAVRPTRFTASSLRMSRCYGARQVHHDGFRMKVKGCMVAIKVRDGLFVSCFALLILTGCTRTESKTVAPILLFNGTGTSPNDVAALAKILKGRGFEYATANSKQLNGMTESEFMAYRLIIIPGGNYITLGNNLAPETTQRIRNAVYRGVNYLGICAGGLLAGRAECNSLDLTSGVKFGFYEAVNRGIHKAAVPIACVETPVIDHYWEDGPQFSGWGLVVGKYPDGTPAIVEGSVGEGWVILCGVHPEAPESWRKDMTFAATARAANEYTGTLVDAALNGRRLPHY